MGFWVHEEVDALAMPRVHSGVRQWLEISPSLWTGERVAVSRHYDGAWIGVWTRGLRWLCFAGEAHPGRHPSALDSTLISVLWDVTAGLHLTV